jgi:nitrate/nitrite transport system substrate-binding protein
MTEMGLTPPERTYKSYSIMGKTFDPDDPEGYIKSFDIKRT